jgi:drug/metabolite transporter (DMT)-like permease
MIKQDELKGIVCVTLSGLLYGFVGYFGVSALTATASIPNMLFWRFLIALIFIGLFLLPHLSKFKENRAALFGVFTAGALFYGSSTYAFFSASKTIGTGMSMVIFFTYPAVVIFCNWLFYRKIIAREYIYAIVLISLGLLLLTEFQLGFNVEGILLSLFSALGYAFYIIASKKNAGLHPLISSWMVCAGCCFFALIFSLLDHSFTLPTDPVFWVNSLGLGIISTALPILLLLQGIQFISSEKAAILGVLEPVFVAITGVMLLGEELGMMQIIGIIIVLSGATLSLLTQAPREKTACASAED